MPKQVNLNNGITITIEDSPFTGGGEGDLYRIISPLAYKQQVLKIYKQEKRTKDRERKIAHLIANPPTNQQSGVHQAIVWPIHIAYQNNQFVGLTMPIAKGEKLELLCHPKLPTTLEQLWKRFSLQDSKALPLRLKICFNIAVALHQIHSIGQYVLVDMKPDNIMIQPNGLISIIDIDSIEVLQQGKVLFPAPVATPEYTPPEYYKGLNLEKDGVSDTWDRFSLAVIFYRLLCGIHPFTGSCNVPFNTCTDLARMVENGLFPHSRTMGRHFRVTPPPHQNFFKLAQPLQDLFIICFENGHSTPTRRPNTNDWCQALSPEPVIQINRVLPSTKVRISSPTLSKELQLNILAIPVLHTTPFLDLPPTNLFHDIYLSLLGTTEKVKKKKQIIIKQEEIKKALEKGQLSISNLGITLQSFLKDQQAIIQLEQKEIDNVKIELDKELSANNEVARKLFQQEIDEIKGTQAVLHKQLKGLEDHLDTFNQVNIQPIVKSYDTQKSPFQNQLNQLESLEKQELEKVDVLLKKNLVTVQSNIINIENQHKARIDQELGLNDINSLRISFKKNHLIAKNAGAIFSNTPKNAIDNLKANGIVSAADFTDIAVLKGDIKKANGRWIKVPTIGSDRAVRLKMWLDKVDVECQTYIINLQRTATAKKNQIHTIMIKEIQLANDRQLYFTNQATQEKNSIKILYKQRKQTLIETLQRLQDECDKLISPIKQELGRLKAEAMNNNANYKADYEHQIKIITHKFDDLHYSLERQATKHVKEVEVKFQLINLGTQKKLIANLEHYTNRHQEIYQLAVDQANALKDIVSELEHLQKSYVKLS